MDLEKFDEIAALEYSKSIALPEVVNVATNSLGDELSTEEELNEEVTTGEELLNLAEREDLTDEQKKEIFIEQLKESKINFRPIKHGIKTKVNSTINMFGWKRKVKEREVQTNVTINQFGSDYKKARQSKNKAQRRARKVSK